MYNTNKYAIIINLFATLHDAPARAADNPLLLYSIYLSATTLIPALPILWS